MQDSGAGSSFDGMSDAMQTCHTGVVWALSAPHSHCTPECCVSYLPIDCQASLGNLAWSVVTRAAKPIEMMKITCINKQCSAWGWPGMTQWHSHLDITLQLPPRAISAGHCLEALTHWHAHTPNDYLCAFKWVKRNRLLLGSVGGFYSKWQGNFSIDWNCYYKIIRQVLNVSLKASLKTVIAEMDSFGTVKKRESCHSLLLVSQGIRVAPHHLLGEPALNQPWLTFEKRTSMNRGKIRGLCFTCITQFSQNIESDKRRWM